MDSNVAFAEEQTSDTNESQVLHGVRSGAAPINYDQSQQQCLSSDWPFPQSPDFSPMTGYAREENNAGYGYGYQFIPSQPSRIPETLFGHPLFSSGNVGHQNDPSFVCNNSPFLNQFSPQYLNSNDEFARQPHADFLRQPHPEFLDTNSLGLEFSRLKIMHDLYQAQIDAQTEAEDEAHDKVKLEENAEPAGFFQNVQPGSVPYMMNWNNGNNLFGGAPYQLENTSKESLEKFQAQQIKFCQLPIDFHQKIQSMPGYEITNIFQVTLVRFLANNLNDSSNVFAVFTRSPETGRNWLMAFAVRKNGLRTIIKFNRLLTTHLKVTVIGQTAVELESSRLTESFLGAHYVFSFTGGEDAKLFLDALSLGINQVWTFDGQPSNKNSHSSAAKLGMWMTRQGIQENIHGVPVGRGRSGINSAIPSNFENGCSRSSSRFNQRKPSYYCDERIMNCFESRIFEFPNDAKFSAEVTLFINEAESSSGSVTIDCDGSPGLQYAAVGFGVLSMVEKANTFNEILFTVNKTEVVCDHKIYAWNDFVLDTEKESNTMCSWNGVVSFSNAKNRMPALKQFLVHFVDNETANQFCKEESKSCREVSVILAEGITTSYHPITATNGKWINKESKTVLLGSNG